VALGLYVHFPYCRRRCPYCDFAIAIAPPGEIPHAAWADAVLEELSLRAPLVEGRELVSIYFGGGTPALWKPAEIGRVIAAAQARLGEAQEITVEANPLDCRPETLAGLRAAGVNRISLGAQSVRDEDLVQLGRDHDAASALSAVAAVRRAGFPRLSVDLIYAVPGLTTAAWERTLARAIGLGPDHLSLYQLTVEPQTPLAEAVRRGKVTPAPDELSAEQFETAHRLLEAAGWEHYEVSAYARPGARAVHNSLYWTGGEYLGIGNGAASFLLEAPDRGVRFTAQRSAPRWLAARPHPSLDEDPRIAEISRQDATEMRADRIWLGLRTNDGVPAAWIDPARVERCLAAGLVMRIADRICPTPKGLLLADELGVAMS
jgi:oxygen-independent coproporphyrinogen-3 oxidase